MESIKGKKYNRGEWAEFYVLLKALGDGRLYSVTDSLSINRDSYLEILRVIREEVANVITNYCVDSSAATVSIKQGDLLLATVPMQAFLDNAKILFEELSKGSSGLSIPAPDSVCEFAQQIFVSRPKAPSVKSLSHLGGKNDIYFEVRDAKTALVSIMGFSIKSRFASQATLFNSGSSSQYLFRLSNCSPEIMIEFNSIRDEKGHRGWRLCKQYLEMHNMQLEYVKPANQIYNDNLELVRDSMAEIMAWCIKDRLISNNTDYGVMETAERLIEANPLHKSNGAVYYPKAIKDFLMASFTGMTAGRVWDGKEQVNGGYIVVTETGDVLCYHSNDRETFRDYLYRNTHFEYVSVEKYKWSFIEQDGPDFIIPLNFSIRFNSDIR